MNKNLTLNIMSISHDNMFAPTISTDNCEDWDPSTDRFELSHNQSQNYSQFVFNTNPIASSEVCNQQTSTPVTSVLNSNRYGIKKGAITISKNAEIGKIRPALTARDNQCIE